MEKREKAEAGLLAVHEKFKHLDRVLRTGADCEDAIYRTVSALWVAVDEWRAGLGPATADAPPKPARVCDVCAAMANRRVENLLVEVENGSVSLSALRHGDGGFPSRVDVSGVKPDSAALLTEYF